MELRCGSSVLSLERAAIMGVLNVTPDSFSDGGLWLDPDAAIKHGLEMVDQGGAIVDVGGESTRPGATPIPEDEELRRVLPVIEGLVNHGVEFVSIDTRKPSVARRALEAGANIINDTAGEESDRAMDAIAAETGAAIVVMHSRGTPETMKTLTGYSAVVQDIRRFLEGRAHELEANGVPRSAIALDPGIGFAKSAEQSALLLRDIGSLVALGYPVLVGASRKSFMGHLLDLDDGQRLEATLATTTYVVAHGVAIVRVHDVEANVRAARMAEAIVRSDEMA
ncbi:MAG: dihydropteroate synthase [Actinomycetota bacterium]|nr:dihydropteroate synthase [Actinomycetota bacterium]